jgi:hypothetical protein
MTNDEPDSIHSTDPKLTPTRRGVLTTTASTLALGATAGCLSGNSDSTDHDSDGSDGDSEPDASTTPEVFRSIDVGRHSLTVALEDPDSLRSVVFKRPTDGVLDRKQAQAEVDFLLMGERGYAPGEFVLEAATENETVAEHTFELQPEPQVTKIELLKNQDREELTWGDGYLCAAAPHAHIYSIKNAGTGPAVLSDMKFDMPAGIDWDAGNGIRCHSPGSDVEWDGGPVLGPGEEFDFSPTARQDDGYRSQEPGDTYDVTMGVVEELTGDWFEQTARMEFIDIGEGNRYPVFEFPSESGD